MELSIILFKQVIIMLLIVIVGVFCHNKKMITTTGKQELSTLLLVIVNPLMIVMSYQMEFQAELFRNLMISFLLATVSYLLIIPLTTLTMRAKGDRGIVERFSTAYQNCGFFGIPLINSVYGTEGVFYLSAYMAMFQIFSWTHGLLLMRGKSEEKISPLAMIKSLISPAIIAPFLGLLLFSCRISLPQIITDGCNAIASMNTPLAMLIAGLTLAQSDIKQVFLNKRIYYISFVKLILVPAVILLALLPFQQLTPMVATIAVLIAGCPSAVLAVLFAVRFERDAVYASEIFTATTILCAVTLPVIMYICQIVFA